MKKAPLKIIILAYITYLFSFAARAYRWMLMLGRKDFGHLFSIVAIHTLSNNIYPARTGELSFIYLLGKEHSKGSLASTLLVARLADIICIALFFTVSALYVSGIGNFTLYGPLVVILLCVLSFAFLYALNKISTAKLPQKLSKFIEDLKDGLLVQKGKYPKVFFSSMLVWGVKYVAFFFLTKAIMLTINMDITFWKSVFGVSFSELTTVLPIHSFGGLGTFEAGWTGAYMIMGYSKSIAVTTGFTFHITLLLFSTLTGLPFLIFHDKIYK